MNAGTVLISAASLVAFCFAFRATYRLGFGRGVERGQDEQYIHDFIVQQQGHKRCPKCGRFTRVI